MERLKDNSDKSHSELVSQMNWNAEEKVKQENLKRIPKKKKYTIKQKVGASLAAFFTLATPAVVFEALDTLDSDFPVVEKYRDLKELAIETGKDALAEFTKNPNEKTAEAFIGLEIEGLNHVYQNGRWEYVDPNDNLTAGYWDEKEGKFELTSNVLRGDWKGLFVAQNSNKIEDPSPGMWSKNNWNEKIIKIPIPFDIIKGGEIKEIAAYKDILARRIDINNFFGKTLIISNLSDGALIFTPYTPHSAFFGKDGNNCTALFWRGGIRLYILYKDLEQYIGPLEINYTGKNMEVGVPILKVNKEDILTSRFLPNDLLSRKYQIAFIVHGMETQHEPLEKLEFSFENLLRNDKGQFIYFSETLEKTGLEEFK
jgi:hypothetical protein